MLLVRWMGYTKAQYDDSHMLLWQRYENYQQRANSSEQKNSGRAWTFYLWYLVETYPSVWVDHYLILTIIISEAYFELLFASRNLSLQRKRACKVDQAATALLIISVFYLQDSVCHQYRGAKIKYLRMSAKQCEAESHCYNYKNDKCYDVLWWLYQHSIVQIYLLNFPEVIISLLV